MAAASGIISADGRDGQRTALEDWLAQDGTLPCPDPLSEPCEDTSASGWWILPMLGLALPAWGALAWLVFRSG